MDLFLTLNMQLPAGMGVFQIMKTMNMENYASFTGLEISHKQTFRELQAIYTTPTYHHCISIPSENANI